MRTKFINCYTCPECQHSWIDRHSAMPDMECSQCGARYITPFDVSDSCSPDDEAHLAFANLVHQIEAGETEGVINMYIDAALSAGVNMSVIDIALSVFCEPA